MSKMRIMAVTSLTACVTALAVAAVALLPGTSSRAAAEYIVDFDEGSYSIWDGSYTFDWYTSPSIIDGVTTYTIERASDLAALAILTNDLGSSEWDSITAEVSQSQYISQIDTFKDAVIKLNTDIDLAGLDWLPISFPWDTPNLTSRYEIHTPTGEVVTYNAVDYIPDDTVDEWVGDENGNPISTRYKEYPESELRFRDLAQSLVGSGIHELYQDTLQKDLTPFMMYSEAGVEHYSLNKVSLPVTAVKHQNFDEDDVIDCYDYKNIKGYTSNPGFEGVFDGNGHNIKGIAPSTPWTDDAELRLTTYDPIAKGLFGMLAEDGVIRNVNVKGGYDGEVVSYSAILCAWMQHHGALVRSLS